MQRAHPEWSKAKAEAQAIVDFETAATELFVSALERGKALRPAALWYPNATQPTISRPFFARFPPFFPPFLCTVRLPAETERTGEKMAENGRDLGEKRP